jgi:hypothetical protein
MKQNEFKFLVVVLMLISPITQADQRVYETDKWGNTRYDKPGYVIKDKGRVHETDQWGNTRYDKPGYVIKDNGKVYETDKWGNTRYDKPSYQIEEK